MPHTLKDSIGFTAQAPATSTAGEENRLREFVNLKLAARGYPIVGKEEDFPFLDLGKSLIASFQEKNRLLSDYLCPADASINAYLRSCPGEEIVNGFFPDSQHLLPAGALITERHGISRMLSLPPDGIMTLPFTGTSETPAKVFVSLLLRPVVTPEVPGYSPEKSMEVRFFAPGNLVSNLDFFESIFGRGSLETPHRIPRRLPHKAELPKRTRTPESRRAPRIRKVPARPPRHPGLP